jgi:hypothetical protein
VEKRKILHCRQSNAGRPARSPSLYRLSYSHSFLYICSEEIFSETRKINYTSTWRTRNSFVERFFGIAQKGERGKKFLHLLRFVFTNFICCLN